MMKAKIPFTLALGMLPLCACQESREEIVDENPLVPDEAKTSEIEVPEDEGAAKEGRARVTADIVGRSGSELTGSAILTEVEDGVRVRVEVSNAEPGLHGLHIHQKADCSAPDATSAGGHFAPRDHEHGLPDEDTKHLGDLGNLEIGEDGSGEKTIVAKNANLDEGDDRSFLGRALMIHAKKDDGGQPTGNAGARIGCGEIPTKPEPKMKKAS
jgi:Cu-Zn family superoxide dismutase